MFWITLADDRDGQLDPDGDIYRLPQLLTSTFIDQVSTSVLQSYKDGRDILFPLDSWDGVVEPVERQADPWDGSRLITPLA